MLDVRPTAFVVPIAEQEIAALTPVIRVQNFADEGAMVDGRVRIYRTSTGLLLYTSVLATTQLAAGATADIAALTPWNPGAPAAADYLIIAETSARSLVPPFWHYCQGNIGPYTFDITPAPMGQVPAGHNATHETGGMDEITLAGMLGLLGTPQTPALHAADHGDGQADEVNVAGLHGELADDQPALAHDIVGARHTSAATPGQLLQADANGLPVDATNTDAEVTDAVSKRDCRANGEASNAAPTPNADTTDMYYLTALAAGATFGAPTGSPVDGQKLLVRILDNGGVQALAWNSGAGGYIARGVALPTTTVASKYLYVGFIYNSVAGKWDCVASSQEA